MGINPFQNSFKPMSRITPDSTVTPSSSLSVPSNVPFVAPVTQTPPNFTLLNNLASVLGVGGVGQGRLGAQLARQAETNRAKREAMDYRAGMVEATKDAAKNRDILTDLSRNGIVPNFKNPSMVLGYQHQKATYAASSYRNDLVKARLENPLKDPQELQAELRSKYVGLLQGANPEIVAEYFLKPGEAADQDDAKLWSGAKTAEFKLDRQNLIGGEVANIIDSEQDLIDNGHSSFIKRNVNVIRGIENSLQVSVASGDSMEDAITASMESVFNKVNELDSVSDKLSLMDTLKKVKVPNGGDRTITDLPKFGAEFYKRRAEIIHQDNADEKDRLETDKLAREEATNTRKLDMLKDAQGGKLKQATAYGSLDVDNDTILTFHSALNKSTASLPEQEDTRFTNNVYGDAQSGQYTPSQILAKYGPEIITRPQVASTVYQAASLAGTVQDRNQKDNTPRNIDGSIVDDLLKTVKVAPRQAAVASGWVNRSIAGASSAETVGAYMTAKIQQKYREDLEERLDQYLAKHPAATPAQQRTFAKTMWHRSYEGWMARDLAKIATQKGSWSDIIHTPIGQDTGNTSRSVSRPPVSKERMRVSYPWMTDRATFLEAKQQFFEKKGPIYRFVTEGRTASQGAKNYNYWKNIGPDALIQKLQQGGYLTFGAKDDKSKSTTTSKQSTKSSK